MIFPFLKTYNFYTFITQYTFFSYTFYIFLKNNSFSKMSQSLTLTICSDQLGQQKNKNIFIILFFISNLLHTNTSVVKYAGTYKVCSATILLQTACSGTHGSIVQCSNIVFPLLKTVNLELILNKTQLTCYVCSFLFLTLLFCCLYMQLLST